MTTLPPRTRRTEPAAAASRVARRAADAGLGGPAPPPERHRVRRGLLVAAAAVAVVLGGGIAYVFWPRPATPITEEDALAQYRAEIGDPSAAAVTGEIPAGVYRYAASGEEAVSIGGVPVPSRTVPELVTLVVQPEGDCTRLTLNLMSEHTESSTYCRDDQGGLVLTAQSKFQQVAGFTTRGATECTEGSLGRPGDGPRAVQCALRLEVAGTTLAVDLIGTARWGAPETLGVAGEARTAERLVLDLTASGDLAGHWTERQWLDRELGVPLRIERDIELDGPGRFAETTTLDLLDLTPSR
ncbi:hypothetical protein [Rhabdothermincola salaria]|uniref:hypothetical protein n=1 Tax=Rhabdothermincola salaria TaxID=2903142 RepID=UPI001E2F4A36|nr:hypothetical protein [Rhabdothermincola salaria]MCD9624388.1 hypothetical protein [Rhabdothermincola salaria]